MDVSHLEKNDPTVLTGIITFRDGQQYANPPAIEEGHIGYLEEVIHSQGVTIKLNREFKILDGD